MVALVKFIGDRKLPEDRKEAHKIKLKSARFCLSVEGYLYKRSFIGPLLQYVYPSKWKTYNTRSMKEFVEAMQEAYLFPTEPYRKGIGESTYKRILKPMSGNVRSVNSLHA